MMDEGTGVQLLQGDARLRLQELTPESVHLCVCSPPYHGLRDYGTGQWEGGAEGCDHSSGRGTNVPQTKNPNVSYPAGAAHRGGDPSCCPRCGARRVDQQIGLEATADEHIAALVEVFALVRKVLRKDGCLIVNYGDAYSGGSQGGGDSPRSGGGQARLRELHATQGHVRETSGLPAKNLLMLPSRLAIALQADGWILRSMLPWLKRSAMPESATDRPSTAVEYVFIFSRSPRYYWDASAVRRPHSNASLERATRGWNPSSRNGDSKPPSEGERWRVKELEYNPNGRNLRNSDFHFDSLDLAIEATRAELAHLLHLREKGGLLLDGEGEPLALDVNPQALADAHFASFPEKLVAPLIQAGSSEHGVCGTCGAPWTRVVEKEYRSPAQYKDRTSDKLVEGTVGAVLRMGDGVDVRTTGWQPSCQCNASVVPATILDPFAGSGTTSLVASKLGRRSIAIELSLPYTEIFNRRNSQKSLLL
jgi:DNA modification methylase